MNRYSIVSVIYLNSSKDFFSKMKFNIFLVIFAIFLAFAQNSLAAPSAQGNTPKPSQTKQDAIRNLIYQAMN